MTKFILLCRTRASEARYYVASSGLFALQSFGSRCQLEDDPPGDEDQEDPTRKSHGAAWRFLVDWVSN